MHLLKKKLRLCRYSILHHCAEKLLTGMPSTHFPRKNSLWKWYLGPVLAIQEKTVILTQEKTNFTKWSEVVHHALTGGSHTYPSPPRVKPQGQQSTSNYYSGLHKGSIKTKNLLNLEFLVSQRILHVVRDPLHRKKPQSATLKLVRKFMHLNFPE